MAKRRGDAEDNSSTKKQKLEYGSDSLIVILVDTEENSFTASRDVLITASDYFKAALKSSWVEGQESVVKIPDMDTEAFQVFLHWAYCKSFDFTYFTEPDLTEAEAAAGIDIVAPTYLSLGKTWATGHYLQSSDMRNAVIDTAISIICTDKIRGEVAGVAADTMAKIWSITPVDSTIRKLYLDIVESTISKQHLREDASIFPPDVMLHLATRFVEGRLVREEVPRWEDRCQYHEHDEGEPECI